MTTSIKLIDGKVSVDTDNGIYLQDEKRDSEDDPNVDYRPFACPKCDGVKFFLMESGHFAGEYVAVCADCGTLYAVDI